MIEITEALELIARHVRPLAAETISLERAVGRVLAEAIASDVDSPPHDKSLMDGFAVRAADTATAGVELEVIDTVLAGQVAKETLRPGTACRVMTGAPIPPGADAVVMLEQTTMMTQVGDLSRVRVNVAVGVGKHIMKQGESMRAGEIVLPAGTVIRPHHLGVLSEVGAATVRVAQRPSVAILATGDELVAVEQRPGPAQIRNSNGPLLAALARRIASEVRDLGIARDNYETLRERIAAGLESDLLILTGGVSAGLADLVPRVLQDCGVRQVFHKVSIKPGKPIWFGIVDRGSTAPPKLVFGLPGNPVSTLVCFEVFVMGACQMLAGQPSPVRSHSYGILLRDHAVRGDRPTYWPVRLVWQTNGQTGVEPLPWRGSSDLRCLADADALAFFPSRETPYSAGEIVPLLTLAES